MIETQHLETLIIHDPDEARAQSAVRQPIHLTTTFERNADGSYPTPFKYSREGNPNRLSLERLFSRLEGGSSSLAFASGSAAALAVVHSLDSRSHIVAPDDMYYGSKQIFRDLYGRWGLECTFVDMSDEDEVSSAIRRNTRLLWIETPSNPMLRISDVEALIALARENNLTLLADNTWATPVSLRPIEWGADVVLHSTTKYVGGHSDVIGGALVFREESEYSARATLFQQKGGAVPSPFDCWLLARSAATLPLRFRHQSASATRIAHFLHSHPLIDSTLYPGLPTHPGHKIAARQMDGFGAMLSVLVSGGKQAAMKLAANLRLFTRATSLGGFESLVEHRASVEGPESTTPDNLLRLSIGLEHVDDLIQDLDQALSHLEG